MTTVIDPMMEGYLVRGTLDPQVAVDRILEVLGVQIDLAEVHVHARVFRKVPGQWSSWLLHDAKPGRGAFEGVAIYTDGRHKYLNPDGSVKS